MSDAVSVVVPAYNEAALIGPTLRAMLASIDSAGIGRVEIVVVANACTDATADHARGVDQRVRVIETPTPGKVNALNLGDGACTLFPRWYLDADIIVSSNSVRDVHAALERPGIHAAAPRMDFDLRGCPWAVRAYYRAWRRTPYFDDGPIAGAYALSAEGRARFGAWPDVISDDGYARLHFEPGERASVRTCSMIVRPPRRTRTLIAIKARSRRGTTELHNTFPELRANESCAPHRSGTRLLGSPGAWLDAPAYAAIVLAARWYARGADRSWARDDTSRHG